MDRLSIRFERDPAADGIEVIVRAQEQNDAVTELMDRLSARQPDDLAVFDGYGRLRSLPAEEIISASVDGKLVNIVTADGSWYTRRTLQSLEELLASKRFVRVSRFELVNLGKVTRFDFTVAGTLRLELEGGMETWASRRCIPTIRRRLMGKE